MQNIGLLVVLVAMFAVFYFIILRPQRKRQSAHQQMVEELQIGDKVITIGGIHGEIESINEYDVILQVEDGNKLKFLKNSIMGKQLAEEIDLDDGDSVESI